MIEKKSGFAYWDDEPMAPKKEKKKLEEDDE